MSEHERGDRVLLRARVDGSGPSGSVVIVADRGTVHHVDPADLIPDDRHRTPIAPEDVREGDVVRIEWEEAHEGPVRSTPNGPRVDSYYVDYPGRTVYLIHRAPTERDKWWPPQAGDVAEWGGHRWSCFGSYWVCLTTPVERVGDDDVPADARLLLPARTREVTS